MHSPAASPAHHAPASPSRRGLLRAAAWSVPAITLATATPAFAATPGATPASVDRLVVTSASATISGTTTTPRTIKGRMIIHNESTAPATGLQAVFIVPDSYFPHGNPAPKLGSTNGAWTLTGARRDGADLVVTITAALHLAAGDSTEVDFEVTATMPSLPTSAPPVHVRPAATNMSGLLPTVSFIPQPV